MSAISAIAAGVRNELERCPLATFEHLAVRELSLDDPPSAASTVLAVAAWPLSATAPAMRLRLCAACLEAELVPVALLDEDDAIEWHDAVARACVTIGVSYEQAKADADSCFRSVDGTRPRGIGGMRHEYAATSPTAIAAAVNSLISDYVKILAAHAAAADTNKIPPPPCSWVRFRRAMIAHTLSECFPSEPVFHAPKRWLDDSDTPTGSSHTFEYPTTTKSSPEGFFPAMIAANYAAWCAAKHIKENQDANLASSPDKSARNEFFIPADYQMPTIMGDGSSRGGSVYGCVPRCAFTLMPVLCSPRKSFAEPLLLQALRGASLPRPPVWLHRQAGRYLPEYRALKGQRNFLDLVADPATATELTLQPVRRFGVDAAILFSDIMAVPIALGIQVRMEPGPVIDKPVRTHCDADALQWDAEKAAQIYKTLRLTKTALPTSRALVGFVGGPWTLLVYISGGLQSARKMLTHEPHLADRLLRILANACAHHLQACAVAGADALQVFDSHAGDLGPESFARHAAPALRHLADTVRRGVPHVPLTLFARNAAHSIALLARTTCYDALSLDWATCPVLARALAGPHVTLQGNLDPEALYDTVPGSVGARTRSMVNCFVGGRPVRRYIVNLGHGTRPDMDPAAVAAFVNEAQTIRIGSRRSELAMAQAKIVCGYLLSQGDGVAGCGKVSTNVESSAYDAATEVPVQIDISARPHVIEVVGVTTVGDRNQGTPIAAISSDGVSGKGLFTRDLETELNLRRVDMVQHSLKDLETCMSPGLILAAVLDRHERRDALVSRSDGDANANANASTRVSALDQLAPGTRVGTSSLRRLAQLKRLHGHLEVVAIRGNVGTRIAALKAGRVEALVLAYAGLGRLGIQSGMFGLSVTPLDDILPAVGQGAIGVQMRRGERGLARLAAAFEDKLVRAECDAERTLLRCLQGGCLVPLGVESAAHRDGASGAIKTKLTAHVWDTEGIRHMEATAGSGEEAAGMLLEAGAGVLLAALRGLSL